MNFTREPLIETIISAKDGFKLSIKSSKSADSEEYLVDAVEVVSFGNNFFYRSQERTKAFFLPVSDYEIQQVKEARLVIKNPTLEKSVKIGGGKEVVKAAKPPLEEDGIVTASSRHEDSSKEDQSKQEQSKGDQPKGEQKRDRKRHRKSNRKGQEESVQNGIENKEGEKPSSPPVPKVPQPGVFSHLLKPPERLISDTLERYRREEPNIFTKPKPVEGAVVETKPSEMASVVDDQELYSEPPKVGELLEESFIDEGSPLIFTPPENEVDIDEPHFHKEDD